MSLRSVRATQSVTGYELDDLGSIASTDRTVYSSVRPDQI